MSSICISYSIIMPGFQGLILVLVQLILSNITLYSILCSRIVFYLLFSQHVFVFQAYSGDHIIYLFICLQEREGLSNNRRHTQCNTKDTCYVKAKIEELYSSKYSTYKVICKSYFCLLTNSNRHTLKTVHLLQKVNNLICLKHYLSKTYTNFRT
jgi:hypothetical protein